MCIKRSESNEEKTTAIRIFYDVYLLVSFWIMAAYTLMIIVVSQKHTASDMEVTWISAKRYLSTRLHGV
jgi:hypothetical protein